MFPTHFCWLFGLLHFCHNIKKLIHTKNADRYPTPQREYLSTRTDQSFSIYIIKRLVCLISFMQEISQVSGHKIGKRFSKFQGVYNGHTTNHFIGNSFFFYSTALKLISRLLTECVSAPTDIKSTPHSA